MLWKYTKKKAIEDIGNGDASSVSLAKKSFPSHRHFWRGRSSFTGVFFWILKPSMLVLQSFALLIIQPSKVKGRALLLCDLWTVYIQLN